MHQADLTPARAPAMSAAALRLWRDFAGLAGRGKLAGAALLVAAGALAEGFGLMLIVPLLTVLNNPADPRLLALFAPACSDLGLCDARGRLALVLALFVAAFTLRAGLLVWRDRTIVSLETAFVEHRRLALVEALAASSWERLAALRHARLTHLLAAEMHRLGSAVRQMVTTLTASAMFTAQLAALALIAPSLAVLALLAAAAAILATLPALRRAGLLAQGNRQGHVAILDLAGQLLGGLKQALAQNQQQAFVGEMAAASLQIRQRNLDHERSAGAERVGSAFALSLGLALVAWFGAAGDGPSLIATIAVLARMAAPGSAVLRSLKLLAGALPAHQGLLAMEAELAPAGLAPAPARSPAPRGDLRFEQVSFTRGDGAVAFDRLDVTIPQGSRIGVTGPSGAGKTTFVDLVCGLLAPQAGRITVGGEALTGPALTAWRGRLGYVGQDSYLFNGTLRRNLTWGLDSVSEAEIAAALQLAEAEEIVAGLPLGLEQTVGERGVRLSGGERQRLALARALIRRPAFLALDEATNAIDLATEGRVLARIAALDWQPTLLIVAHRAEALAPCQRILRFEAGRFAGEMPA